MKSHRWFLPALFATALAPSLPSTGRAQDRGRQVSFEECELLVRYPMWMLISPHVWEIPAWPIHREDIPSSEEKGWFEEPPSRTRKAPTRPRKVPAVRRIDHLQEH